MIYKPRPYQPAITEFMVNNRKSALFVDMGLGKTSIALSAMKGLSLFTNIKALVIAPKRVADIVWIDEIDKWDHIKFKPLRLSSEKDLDKINGDYNFFIINVEYTFPYIAKLADICNTLIIDESHNYKNHKSKRHQLLSKHVHKFTNRYLLTGTPITKNYLDLWAQIYLLDPNILGSKITHYRRKYFNAIQRGYGAKVWFDFELKEGAKEEIDYLIRDYCLYVDKSVNPNMPKIIYNDVYVNLDDKCQKQYDRLYKDLVMEFDDEKVLVDSLTTRYIRCQQYANGAVYKDVNNKTIKIVHLEKVNALKEIIDNLNGKGLLIAYWYDSDKYLLKKYFKNINFIDGKNDTKIIRSWNNKKINLLAGHPDSVATGLNLQYGGNHIAWFSLCNRPYLYDQFNARLCRDGQTQTVHVHNIICKIPTEKMIIKSNKTKVAVLDSLKQYLKEYYESKRNE